MDIGAAHVDAVEHLSRRDGRLKTARALAHVGVQPQRQVELAAAQHVHAGHNGRAAREVQLQGRHLEIARDERVHKLSERELVDEEAAAERAVAHAGNCGHRVPQHTSASMKFVQPHSAWFSWAERFTACSPTKPPLARWFHT